MREGVTGLTSGGAPVFGSFRAVRELFRGPMGSVYAAVREPGAGGAGGTNPIYVVRTCTPPVDVVGLESARRLVEEFLTASKLQKQLAEGAGTASTAGETPGLVGTEQLASWDAPDSGGKGANAGRGAGKGEVRDTGLTGWALVHAMGACAGRAIGDEWLAREQELPGAFVVLDRAMVLGGDGASGAGVAPEAATGETGGGASSPDIGRDARPSAGRGVDGSLLALIRTHTEVDGPFVRRMFTEMAHALTHARQRARRGHGNLRASNVLLLPAKDRASGEDAGRVTEGPIPLDRLHVSLTSPSARWGPGDAERDIRALAHIIHLLVTFKPYQDGWSGSHDRWSALGAGGQSLRKLVESILDPAASAGDGRVAGLSIEDLAGAIAKTARAADRKRAVLAGVGLTLALCGSVGGYFYWKHVQAVAAGQVIKRWNENPQLAQANWQEFCAEYRQWFAFLLKRLEEKPSPGVLAAVQASAGGGTGSGSTPSSASPPRIETRRELFALDPELAQIVRRLREADVYAPGSVDARARDSLTSPWAIARVSEGMDLQALALAPTDKAREDASMDATESMLGLMKEVREKLTSWKGPDDLKAAGDELNALGWTRAGRYLQTLVGRFSGDQDNLSADVAGDIDAVVAVRPRVESIRTRWKEIQESVPELARIEDPVLARFTGAPAASVSGMDGDAGRAGDLRVLDDQLLALRDQARQAALFLKDKWRAIDAEALREGPEYRALLGTGAPSPTLLQEWVRAAEKYPALDPATDPRRGWGVEEAITALDALVPQFAGEELDQPLDEVTLAALVKLKADAVVASPNRLGWTRRNQSRVESEASRLKELASRLRTSVEKRKADRLVELAAISKRVRDELGARAEVVPGSPVLNAAWVRGRDALLASIDPKRFKELTRQATALEESVKAIDGAVPKALTRADLLGGDAAAGAGGDEAAWADAFAQATVAQRDARLTRLLGSEPPSTERLRTLAEAARQVGVDFGTYMQGLKDLVTQASALSASMAAGYAPSESIPPGDRPSIERLAQQIGAHPGLQEAPIAQALAPLLARVDALKATMQESDPRKLVGVIQSSAAEAGGGAGAARPELVLAAWRRLGENLTGAGRFPETTADLDTMAALKAIVQRTVTSIPDNARRGELTSALIEREVPRRYIAFASSRTSAEQMQEALSRREALGVRLEELPEALAYNAALVEARLRFETGKLDELGAFDEGVRFAQLVQSKGSGVASAPGVSAMLARVADLTRERPDQVKKIDPKTLGPGSIGWRAEEDAQTGRLTFTSPSNVTVIFERVEPNQPLGTDAFYIAQTETPLRVALGLLTTPAQRNEFQAAMPIYEADTGWTGPRVWEWKPDRSGTTVTIAKGTQWLFKDANVTPQDPAFAPDILAPGTDNSIRPERGGDPTLDHPMQRLGPTAAAYLCRLAGCRLPTSAEWKSAYEALIVSHNQQNNKWNLRDRTFEVQREHILGMQNRVQRKASFQFPDSEIAKIDPSAPAGARAAARKDIDDGVLYFAKVDDDQATLKHLVGNVAEYVFDDAAAFELATPTVQGLGSVVEKKTSPLRVIGASALSPPSVPPETPAPVDILAAGEGFADVGFRMCFGASGTAIKAEPLAVKLRKALSDDAFILAR